MTLTATLVTDDILIQVSDRRTTYRNGVLATDESNKSVVLRCRDGVVAATFTGLASLPKSNVTPHGRIDQWLARTFLLAGAAELGCGQVAATVEAAATDLFGALPTEFRIPHSFMIAGLPTSAPGCSSVPHLIAVDSRPERTRITNT